MLMVRKRGASEPWSGDKDDPNAIHLLMNNRIDITPRLQLLHLDQRSHIIRVGCVM
jgi:hypothetical protein